MTEEIRRHYRFENFSRAFALLREAAKIESPNDLEQSGIISRFLRAHDLACKMLTERLEDEGVLLTAATPRIAIKKAVAANFIDNHNIWYDMGGFGNDLSCLCDAKKSEQAVETITIPYLAALKKLHNKFQREIPAEIKK
ncbi:MAG: HI0074 family nucleotidyltransferase substrate-binding subunit [Gammaproteobacteria bacterium]